MEVNVDKGRIVFLNGVTSSGKTSIVEAIQECDGKFFYVVANDLFQQMVGDKSINTPRECAEMILEKLF